MITNLQFSLLEVMPPPNRKFICRLISDNKTQWVRERSVNMDDNSKDIEVIENIIGEVLEMFKESLIKELKNEKNN